MIGVDIIGAIRRAYLEQHRPIKEIVRTSGFNDAVVQAETVVASVAHFETETGFAVLGAAVTDAIVAHGERPIIRTPG